MRRYLPSLPLIFIHTVLLALIFAHPVFAQQENLNVEFTDQEKLYIPNYVWEGIYCIICIGLDPVENVDKTAKTSA